MGKGLLTAALVFGSNILFGNSGDPISRIASLYHKADSLFLLSNNTPVSDSVALAGFERVIAELQEMPATAGKDTLLFESYLKKGILLDSKYDYSGAKTAYCRALSIHSQPDSLTFVLHVYIGTSYYNLNNFDSARYFLLIAESRSGRFKDPEDNVRLYNTLGVLYFDNGNYGQGKNYFNQALGIVKDRKPFDTASAVSLETNIATCFYHLGLFRESLEIYHQILVYHSADDPIYLNMGMAYTSLEKYRDALGCFRKVNVQKIPGVLNEMGYALWQLQRPDSAAKCLDRFESRVAAESNTGGSKINELDLGTNELYRADLLAGRGDYITALQRLQQAIIIFSHRFDNPDIHSNPANFTGTFASYRLFDALFKKAVLLERLFRSQPREEWLVAACEAYKASLSILRYIEKSYDTDDAKLFLKKKNSAVYQGAFSVCLQLYRLHPDRDYLEQAFLISERSKASVIAANLQERTLNRARGSGTLQKQEEDIKYNVARLNVKLEQTTGKSDIEKISAEKAGYEIELARLIKQLEQNGNYYKQKYEDSTPGVKALQQHLDRHQALISCYLTANALHIFLLTASSFAYTRVDSLSLLRQEVADWLELLKTTESGRKFRGEALGSRLSQLLIKPVQTLLPDKDEWIIVPDGFLYFLPFESLPSAVGVEDKTLLETTTISYQFASRLILTPEKEDNNESSASGVLAFAPFTGKEMISEAAYRFPPLPASGEEIAGLPGSQYLGSQATKSRFLQTLNQYPIVHLATHAVSSIDNAAGSFIAFYPEKGAAIEDCLFLEELYGLDMNKTKLVVISACETGQGELVSNEGVISLARAFAYAGCASSISSLWKADDQATSFILQRFYVYLRKGYKKSSALRQAKLDYLRSGTVNKSPAYWSHLLLIGDPEPLYRAGFSYWWWLLLLLLPGLGLLLRGAKKRKKADS
ncbi:MAG TPA: CHAT domain-containing tetratricopeptide repeat protein [Puia sp.]|jgi:CHAT domain-containing protein|nr:CHAT domain-containing tetratricopeptide repeat protein [Puia sp.]